MADQNNSTSTANLSSSSEIEEKTCSQLSVHFCNEHFFLVSYSINFDHSHSAYMYPHSRGDQETHPRYSKNKIGDHHILSQYELSDQISIF